MVTGRASGIACERDARFEAHRPTCCSIGPMIRLQPTPEIAFGSRRVAYVTHTRFRLYRSAPQKLVGGRVATDRANQRQPAVGTRPHGFIAAVAEASQRDLIIVVR